MKPVVTILTRQARALEKMLHLRMGRFVLAFAAVALLASMGYVLRPAPVTTLADITAVRDPGALSEMDKTLYSAIFDAQERHDSATVATLIPQLENPILLGHVLAVEYLSDKSKPSNEELTAWLAMYGDHPQAARIAALARSRGLSVDVASSDDQTLHGSGSVFHMGRSTMPDNWYEGLRLWKEQKFSDAAHLFSAIGSNSDLNEWQRSAGSYWAYRSLLRNGDKREAADQLELAADAPLTFYGQLALAREGRGQPIIPEAPQVSYHLRTDPHVQRAHAFSQLGMSDMAELELRNLYATLDEADRPVIATLAAEMNLPNLQLRIAQLPQMDEGQALFATYPVPADMVTASADVIDPALVLAVARHESAFRDDVQSSVGAAGMMQMMPATANHVLREVARNELDVADNDSDAALPIAKRLSDATLSAKLGATYLRMLEKEPAVGSNLMKVLAAYNAGPGSVANWQKSARSMNDPLLYMESIPYPETHNYVMQVMAHYWIYQNLMGERPASLAQLANGMWPTVS